MNAGCFISLVREKTRIIIFSRENNFDLLSRQWSDFIDSKRRPESVHWWSKTSIPQIIQHKLYFPTTFPLWISHKYKEELPMRKFHGYDIHSWESEPFWPANAKKNLAKFRTPLSEAAVVHSCLKNTKESMKIYIGKQNTWENVSNWLVFISCWLFQHILGTRWE